MHVYEKQRDRLAVKGFAAYDADPFLSRMLITWYAMSLFPALRSGTVILMGREGAADLQPRKWVERVHNECVQVVGRTTKRLCMLHSSRRTT